jgi:uncharacterized membrane protein
MWLRKRAGLINKKLQIDEQKISGRSILFGAFCPVHGMANGRPYRKLL